MRLLISMALAVCIAGVAPARADGPVAPRSMTIASKDKALKSIGTRYALCIGIDHYPPGNGYPALHCAVADAKSLGAAFKALGYVTTVMTDDSPGDLAPTCANLELHIRDLARQARGSNDELVISYAGHGDVVDDQAALVPIDYTADHPNLLPVGEVLSKLNDTMCQANCKLLLLDACHAAKMNSNRFLLSFANDQSLMVFSACDTGQNSREDLAMGHGRFTQAVIWGLVGKDFSPPATRPVVQSDEDADVQWHGEAYANDADGELLATQLFEYVGKVFKEKGWSSATRGGPRGHDEDTQGQNPHMFGDEDVTAPMIVAERDVPPPKPPSPELRQTIASVLQQAQNAYVAGQYSSAINFAETALVLEKGNPDALALRALVNLRTAYTHKAQKDAADALKADPNQAMALQVRGLCAAGNQDARKALACLRNAQRLIANDPARWALLAKGDDAANRLVTIGDLSGDNTEAFACYSQAAHTSGASQRILAYAALSVGFSYSRGDGAAQDYHQAMTWYRKAADAGDASAMNNIGYLYDYGRGVGRDYKQAIAWYRKSADAANSTAMYNIAELYLQGHGVNQDNAQAMAWFGKSADAGNDVSMFNVGWMYEMGEGVPEDDAKALVWYHKAADAGNADAMYNYGWLLEHGQGIHRDHKQSLAWYRKAADAGSSDAMNNLGFLCETGWGVAQDYAKAMDWYRKAADRGDVDACVSIGRLYAAGSGVDQDYSKAMDWYRKAADAGNSEAMYHVGSFYMHGRGAEQDYGKAAPWLGKAADAGNAEAMVDIGWFYQNGLNFKQDYVKAMAYYQKAANLGQSRAMYCIAVLYENGWGVAKDPSQAAAWYREAADAGDDDAQTWVAAHGGK